MLHYDSYSNWFDVLKKTQVLEDKADNIKSTDTKKGMQNYVPISYIKFFVYLHSLPFKSWTHQTLHIHKRLFPSYSELNHIHLHQPHMKT